MANDSLEFLTSKVPALIQSKLDAKPNRLETALNAIFDDFLRHDFPLAGAGMSHLCCLKMKNDYSIAHIAVAVPGLREALKSVETVLGLKAGPLEEVPEQKVKLQFVDIGGVRFEFLEPTDKESPISKFVEKRGGGIHHLALYVSNIEEKLKELKAKGVPLINETPQVGAEGCRVAFLHPKAMAGILVELIERPSN